MEMRELHLGRESQSPEAKESIYSNVHSGCYRWGVRELGFGPKTPTQSLRKALRQGREYQGLTPGEPYLQSPLIFVGISLFIFFVFGFPLFK